MRKIIHLGTNTTSDLAKQRVIRLLNTIALMCFVTAFISEVYVLLFIEFYLGGVIMALFACTVSLFILYFNARGLTQYPIWLLISFINLAMIYTAFLIDSAMGVSNMYFSAFVLYVAVLERKRVIVGLSVLSLLLLLITVYIHENRLVEPILYFEPSQVLPIKYIFTINSAALVLLIAFFLKTNMNAYKKTVELANHKLNVALDRISSQNTELEESLNEKNVLLKEIHHRIKNNFQIIMSLLDLQMDGLDDSDSKDAINEAKGRINSMALIHQRLYQSNSLQRISIYDYFQQIIEDNFSTFSQDCHDASYKLNYDDFEMNMEQAVPLGLIFNELVTNFLKHVATKTKGSKLEVDITIREDILTFTTRDNGDGLPESFLESAPTNSLGLLLIEMLVRQLDGVLRKSNNHGFINQIEFVLEK